MVNSRPINQRNSKDFVSFVRRIFPGIPMASATKILTRDLEESITYGSDIGKKYKRIMMKNKRGSLLDLIWIGVTLLIISMVLLIVFKIQNDINVEIQESSIFEGQGKRASQDITNLYPGVLDNSFMLLTISLAIGAFVLAALVRIHPVFIVGFLILLALIIFMAGIFSNIYQAIAGNEDMVLIAQQLTFTHQIMTTLPFIVGIFGGLLAIVMYKTYQGAGGF